MAYTWPTTQTLRKITSVKIEALMADDPISTILPIANEDSHYLEWEVEDNNYGLQQARGLDGPPARVNKLGSKRYLFEPGVYGEFMVVNETEMTMLAREIGTVNERMTMDNIIDKYTTMLAQREVRRIKYIGWTLLTTKSFSVTGPNGQVLHTDTFSITDYNATTWATIASATPLADLAALITLGPTYGTNFGAGATVYMNDATFRNMMKNTNAADLGGRRVTGLQPVNNRPGLQEILTGDGLANIQVYDGWYNNDSDAIVRFIPDGKAVAVGQRPNGEALGEYAMTFNANNPGGASGPYAFVNDTRGKAVPPTIEIHRGHNGGPILWYPGSIVLMDVS
jgi:hypothetical protein